MRQRNMKPAVDRWKMQDARRRAGYSRPGAAEALGITVSSVNAYEQGRTDPSLRIILQMAWLYRTSVEKLCRSRAEITAELDGNAA
ncbi:MAG: helix-turn-helix transcriptional regulator [Actinomycetia bacterium]|nr:helix-turn-helix transcriptional regulator [Actinomycetes bacterium]